MNLENNSVWEKAISGKRMISGSFNQRLADACHRLLDLTLRNKLLKYKPTKTKHLGLEPTNPIELFQWLVDRGRACSFGVADEEAESEPIAEVWWDQETPELQDKRRVWPLVSQTDEDALERKLRTLAKEADTVIEEQGYNALFLALGFLEWRESDAQQEVVEAPLILVPVELRRRSVNSKYHLHWDEAAPVHNLSLWEKLKEQSVNLPDPAEVEGIRDDLDEAHEIVALLREVHARIQHKDGWRLIPKIALGFFSFTKFIMFKDLKSVANGEVTEDVTGLLQAILDDDNPNVDTAILDGDGSNPFDEERLDELIDWSKVHYVKDADPSQIAAIQDVQAGKSIIVEGPPGTGKSQTITNLIGELIANGKKVLFVSEKKAALDVVKDRLDEVGLGPFVLSLHGHGTTKKECYRQLRQAFSTAYQSAPARSYDDELEARRNTLNGYARAIGTPIYEGGPNPAQIYGTLVHLRQEHGEEIKTIDLPTDLATNADGIAHCQKVIQEYRHIHLGLDGLDPHPWRGTDPHDLSPTKLNAVRQAIPQVMNKAEAVLKHLKAMEEDYRIRLPATHASWEEQYEHLRELADTPPIDPGTLTDARMAAVIVDMKTIREPLEAYQRAHDDLPASLRDRIWEEDLDELAAGYRAASRGLFFLKPSYWRTRGQYLDLFTAKVPRSRKKVKASLDVLCRMKGQRITIHKQNQAGRFFLGEAWQGVETDVSVLITVIGWVEAFLTFQKEGFFREDIVDRLHQGWNGQGLCNRLDCVDDAWRAFLNDYTDLKKQVRACSEHLWRMTVKQALLDDILETLSLWNDNLEALTGWAHFRGWLAEAEETHLSAILPEMEKRSIPYSELRIRFQWSLAMIQADHAWTKRKPLAQFSAPAHEGCIEEFQALDRAHNEWSRNQIQAMVSESIRQRGQANVEGSEASIVKHELEKKRRNMAIRRLLQKAGNVVLDLKPCFMMSPLSIAHYLKPGSVTFDVVVFDEASQVRPEDAYGTLLRGRQVVIVGDTRQLPPTTFFDHVDEDEQADEVFRTGDYESILSLARAKFPESRVRMLRWHYRSKHESLIAPSNQEFYDNRLQTFPSPFTGDEEFGLHFVHVEDGFYDRGRSRTNRVEAQRIARDAMEHVQVHRGEKSIGIVAMSSAQQRAIEDALYELRRNYPDLEEYFQRDRYEYVFVKNLETVQGDERDVILISIGYGFTGDGQPLRKNFGPVNNEGGERRLNVLFTRARERIQVYANFSYQDLSVKESDPYGVRALKMFLETAETGRVPETAPGREDTDSPFEDAVKDFLQSQGYEVHTQVGCSGYRIDLAVVHRDYLGTYAVAIECDGATYHSSCVARERDRLRQQVLENLGWRFHRIWSSDWFQRPVESKRALLSAIEQAMQKRPSTSTPTSVVKEKVPEKHVDEEFYIEETALDAVFPVYESMTAPSHGFLEPFHESPLATVADAVEVVVRAEAPVHPDIVIERIRRAAGAGRAGRLIRERIHEGIRFLSKQKRIREDEHGFLWGPEDASPRPRCRKDAGTWTISQIAPAEIQAAAKHLQELNGQCPPEELARATARALGFSRVRTKTLEEVQRKLAE